jgi:hypothetical protein
VSTIILSLVTIVAIVVGPILALYVQRKLDEERAAQGRKFAIFRNLMAHRATRLNPAFVEALNAIEVEFYASDGSTNKVIEAWHEYCEHLYHPDFSDPAKVDAVANKATDLLHNLLSEMSEYLGYHFERGILRRMLYYPRGWGDTEQEQAALRKATLEIFSGNKPLHMTIDGPAK